MDAPGTGRLFGPVSEPFAEQTLQRLAGLIQRFCAIRVPAGKLRSQSDRLQTIVRTQGLPTLDARCDRLERELIFRTPRAWDALLPLITVHETYFFREMGQLEVSRPRLPLERHESRSAPSPAPARIARQPPTC